MKIYAPAGDGYTGDTWIGPVHLQFTDGAAEFDGDLPDGVRLYLQSNGYGINGKAKAAQDAPAEQPDSRDIGEQLIGTELRDAAIDPRPEDFLPPVGAGDADPHGPDVVSPGIHGLETKPVLPGDVSDLERQNARESELAARTLAGDEPVPHVVAELADGALDRKVDAADPDAENATAEQPEAPAKKAPAKRAPRKSS